MSNDTSETRFIPNRAAVLVTADTVSFAVTVVLAMCLGVVARWALLGVVRFPSADDLPRIIIVFVPALLMLIWRSGSLGHYSQFRPFWPELLEVVKTVLIIGAFDFFLLFIMGVQFSRLWFGFFLMLLCLLVPYGRELSKMAMIRRNIWYQETYIVGTGDNAVRTAAAIESDSSLGHRVAGFVDLSQTGKAPDMLMDKPVISTLQDIERIDMLSDKTSLVFAFESVREMETYQEILDQHIASSAYVSVVPPPMGLPLYGASVTGIFRHDTALLKLQNQLLKPKSRITKRVMDLVVGLASLAVFSPVFLILAVLIKRDGGPVFYRHKRIGLGGTEFDCLKFRSMMVDGDTVLDNYLASDPDAAASWQAKRKLTHDPRVTSIGNYLRRTSVDELPQLWNVIKGDMSLVGPRPIVEEERAKYTHYLSYYLTMTPGMTGLWQVSGRTDTSYAERVRLDVWYSRNWSLWNDLVILIQTCKTLINRHGAY